MIYKEIKGKLIHKKYIVIIGYLLKFFVRLYKLKNYEVTLK